MSLLANKQRWTHKTRKRMLLELRGEKSFTCYMLVDEKPQRVHWTKKWVQLSILWAQLSRHRFYMWAASLACCTQITSINTSTAQLEPLYTALCNCKVTYGRGRELDYDWGSVQYEQTGIHSSAHTHDATCCPHWSWHADRHRSTHTDLFSSLVGTLHWLTFISKRLTITLTMTLLVKF